MTESNDDLIKKDIIAYYKHLAFSYQIYSAGTHNIHYGYWENGQQEELRRKEHRDALERMNAVLANIAQIRAEDIVFDAGCGMGGSAVWLAKTFACRVTGVALCEHHIAHAQDFARKNNVDRLCSFFAKDFLATGFDAASFDLVWALESCCYTPDKRSFLEEAARLLKPGGRLIVADGFLHKTELSEQEQEMLNRWMRGWAVPNVLSGQEFGRYLEESGFEDIGFTEITENILPTSLRMHQIAKVIYPFSLWANRLGICSEQSTNHWYSALNQFRFFTDDLACYGIFSARKAA